MILVYIYIYIYMYIYIYIYPGLFKSLRFFFIFGKFFTPALADGLSLESEGQVSSGRKDSSQYSGRSQ